MNIIKTDIEGVLIIEPRLFRDARGYFFESFSEREFEEKVAPILGHSVHFCQDNESMSSFGVMRGLHFQRPPYTQSKLVRCVKGRVLDVASNISVITSITQRQMEVSLSSMTPSISIGRSQQSMPISQKKIQSMPC